MPVSYSPAFEDTVAANPDNPAPLIVIRTPTQLINLYTEYLELPAHANTDVRAVISSLSDWPCHRARPFFVHRQVMDTFKIMVKSS
jgi:hypothetical protein